MPMALISSMLLTPFLCSRPELDRAGQGGDLFLQFGGELFLRGRGVPGDGEGAEELLRRQMAAEALDHHGAGQGQGAVQVADGKVEAVLETLVGVVPFGVEGLEAGVAVD